MLLILGALAFYYFYYRKKEDKSLPTDAYLLALKYMVENDNRRAVEKLKETVRHDTQNIDAYIKLGDILRMEGLYFNAIRIHKDLTLRGNISEDDMPKIWYSLALDYWHSQKYDKAEIYFKKLLGISEYQEGVVNYLTKIYEKDEEYKKAFAVLINSPSANQKENKRKLALLKVMEGLELVQQNDEKNSRILFKEALKHDPWCAAAYMYLGDSYMREDRRDDAINTWMQFCKKAPKKSSVLFSRLEKAWYEKGQFSKIEELYESILKRDLHNTEALLALSSIYRKKGDYQTALSLVQDGFKQEMDEDALNSEMVRILFEKAQFKEAAKQSLNLIEKFFTPQYHEYICPECGYKSKEPFWKCSKCNAINLNL
jgi:lipopolysaccharide biosynthesis regulator YciM